MKAQILLFAAALILQPPGAAAAAGPLLSMLGRSHHTHKCGGSGECVATVEEVQVEKHCWNVKCEEVCIPRVQVPWPWLAHHYGNGKAHGCQARCGKTRSVRVLTKDQYECTECKCVWTPVGKGGYGKHQSACWGDASAGGADRIPAPPLPGQAATPTVGRYFDYPY